MSRNCSECGRYLASLKSQAKGIGPKCLVRKRRRLALSFKPVQRDKARMLRKARSLSKVKPGVYRVRSGDSVYLTASNTCTCPSGKYRLTAATCYHSLAVQQEDA